MALLGAHHIFHFSRIRVKGHFNPLNAELNPICHLLALLGAHHILNVSRVRVKGYFNTSNAELNPIFHLLELLRAHHILHVSRVRVKGHFSPLNAKLNPNCHLLALLGTHHILHVSRIRVNTFYAFCLFNSCSSCDVTFRHFIRQCCHVFPGLILVCFLLKISSFGGTGWWRRFKRPR